MDHFDMVEKLREKAKVSYMQAKEALEQSDWDMTEAIVLLERDGLLKESSPESEPQERAEKETSKKPVKKHTESLGNLFEVLAEFISKLAQKGNKNHLEVYREDQLMFKVPLTVLVILLIVGFWVLIPAMLISWFAGIRYRFAGKDIDRMGKEEFAREVK